MKKNKYLILYIVTALCGILQLLMFNVAEDTAAFYIKTVLCSAMLIACYATLIALFTKQNNGKDIGFAVCAAVFAIITALLSNGIVLYLTLAGVVCCAAVYLYSINKTHKKAEQDA